MSHFASPTGLLSHPGLSSSGQLPHLKQDFSGKDFNFYFIGTDSIEHTFAELAEKDLVTGETIGISVALIILALVFGSVS